MTKKYILTFFTLLIFISTLLINCGDDLSFKKEISNMSNSKIIKEKTKKENLEETKYYINKNYDSLLNICKEWQSLQELIKEEDEENNEAIKNKVFYIFKNIKHIWLKIEKRSIPNSYDGENFFNELKFIKEKQLKAIEYFTLIVLCLLLYVGQQLFL